jgi:hypothetical protein
MRELTKSTLSAGLAMLLFGMQAMLNTFRRSEDGGRSLAAEDFDAITQAMVDRTGDILRETFQVGDKLQRGLVDMTFGLLTLAPLRSGGGMSSMGDATRQATDELRRWMGGMGMGGAADPTAAAPMPLRIAEARGQPPRHPRTTRRETPPAEDGGRCPGSRDRPDHPARASAFLVPDRQSSDVRHVHQRVEWSLR